MSEGSMERVIAYVDGFNVYEGIRSMGWKGILWLDYRALVEQFILREQELVEVVYFTAHRTNPPESFVRQQVYLSAVEATKSVRIVHGRFGKVKAPCVHCGRITTIPKEHETDVNIASEMIAGAAHNLYDTAILITGDSDFVGAIKAVESIPGKRVKLLRPPGRRNDDLAAAAGYVRDLRKVNLTRAQLPDPVVRPDGKAITCPFPWLTVQRKASRLNLDPPIR